MLGSIELVIRNACSQLTRRPSLLPTLFFSAPCVSAPKTTLVTIFIFRIYIT